MIELTVKTLDSKNYSFTVPDNDITVRGFKEFIEKAVDIPPNIQRLIFAGRVLEDEKKLSDYGVQGNCVHLVTHAPPSDDQSQPNSTSSPPPNTRNRGRTFEFVGAGVRYPRNFDVSQSPPTSLAPGRLNVAKRMLREADRLLNELEQLHQSSTEQSTKKDDEIPNPAASVKIETIENVENCELPDSKASTSKENINPSNEMESTATTSENVSTDNQSNTNTQPINDGTTASSNNTIDGVQISEFAVVLHNLNSIQARFQPYLEYYTNFMESDPEVPEQQWSQKQRLINRTSQLFHFLGHAYHAISDMIVRVRSGTPRYLMCRPIILHHSILQPGIPIQLEAQINFGTPTTNETTVSHNTTSTSNNTANTGNTTGNIGTFLGFPILPPGAISIQRRRPANDNTSRLTAREFRLNASSNNESSTGTRTDSNSENTSQMVGIVEETGFSGTLNSEIIRQVLGEDVDLNTLPTSSTGTRHIHGTSNNSNVEVYMELPSDLNDSDIPETPDILQTLMQAASQVIGRGPSVPLQSSNMDTVSSAEHISTEGLTASSQSGTTRTTTQARGNTQTQSTTATRTRSTARPQVHFSHHSSQSFDPFLLCNSHHLGRGSGNNDDDLNSNSASEIQNPSVTQRTPNYQREASQNNQTEPNHLVYNFTHNFFTSVRLNRGDASEAGTASTSSNSSPTNHIRPMDVDQSTPGTSSSSTSTMPKYLDDIEMPLHQSSEQNQWQKQIPEAWVPLITKDSQNQKKMKSQPPFSDAYISTMPNKRRKLLNDSKFPPHNDLPELISASIQNAITESGLDLTNSSVQNATAAVSQDEAFQTAFEDNLRTAVQNRLRDSDDFSRERFPNATEYFMNYHSQ